MYNYDGYIKDSGIDTNLFLETTKKWLLGTENIMRNCLKQYDTQANVNIEMCCDISLPSNVIRFAGGFMTGTGIQWDCQTPFIPVDTTLNVCNSSIYLLEGDLSSVTSIDFEHIINNAKDKKGEYIWNYDISNHFIILGKDKDNKRYLITHSSAAEFKKQLEKGLYPMGGNRYENNMKIYKEGERYIRYLIGADAETFCNIYQNIPQFNNQRQDYFAHIIARELKCRIISCDNKNHYGMKNNNIIHIGTFLSKTDDIVPIFSDIGKDIILYQVNNKDPKLGNYHLIPHGRGKTNTNVYKIGLENNKLYVGDNSYDISYNKVDGILRDYSLDNTTNNHFITKTKDYLHGNIVNTIEQVYCYNKDGIYKKI